jgi:glycine/D-amino acid oxidase-like deaminating enzyme
MNAAAIAKAEPNLARNLTGGLLVPQDAIVIPSVAALAMAEQAQELGAVWMLGKSVREFGYQSLLLNDGGELRADRIVNALGVDSIELSPDIPIRKRKGHLAITDRYPGFIQHQLVELGYMKSADITTADSVAFNVQPRRSGQLLVGSSRQFGSEDTVIDQHILSAMLARASLYLPGLSKLDTLRAWTGFRAATPDKLPLIGPDPTNTSLLLATGHEGLGITASLATAELIADYVCKQKSVIPAEPYLPARFLNNTPYKT